VVTAFVPLIVIVFVGWGRSPVRCVLGRWVAPLAAAVPVGTMRNVRCLTHRATLPPRS
jgi:hypothetical protein